MDPPDTVITMQPTLELAEEKLADSFQPVAGVPRDDRALRQHAFEAAAVLTATRAGAENTSRAYVPRDIAEDIVCRAQKQAEDLKAWAEQALARQKTRFAQTFAATTTHFTQEYTVRLLLFCDTSTSQKICGVGLAAGVQQSNRSAGDAALRSDGCSDSAAIRAAHKS